MKIPILYNLRSLRARPTATLTTALGMALVVAVFIGMMALSIGFQAALVKTGSTENILVLRRGADSELSSGINRDVANAIAALPFVARDSDGEPLISPETFVVVGLERRNGGMANVVIRGISPKAFDVRNGVHIIKGRTFRPGSGEIIVGETLVKRVPNTEIGESLRFAGRDWEVVGHFETGGSSFESEVWGENELFMPVFRGEVFQTIALRMEDPSAFEGVVETLEADPRLAVDAQLEREFYANQGTFLGDILRFLAVFIAGVMAIGAVFGAVNTMYSAVDSRAPEIGVLLALGFKPRSVLASFVVESMLIALLGGLIGCLIALPINGLVTSTTNWNSFSEVAFAFRVTPTLLVAGIVFALVMGVIGGFLPARRAAKRPVVEALREVGS
jgi:ABC-type lipoprotein release transport system permease subunit